MFKRSYEGFLMNADSEASGGGSGAVTNQASGDTKQVPAEQVSEADKRISDYESRIAALDRKNAELLSENKVIKSKVSESEKKISEVVKKTAEEQNNFEQLYKITLEEKKSAMERLESIERTQNEEALKVVKTQMWNAFTKTLGAEIIDPVLAEKVVGWDKFVEDKESKIGFNEDGVKQAANDFRQKYGFMLKTDAKQMPATAAKDTATDDSKLSFAERALKSGLLGGRK